MSILCIVFYYEYQYQAFPGLIRRVFIIQFVTASLREQFEVLLELYIDHGTSQVDPRTLLPRNNQADPGTIKFFAMSAAILFPGRSQVTIRPCFRPVQNLNSFQNHFI